MPQSADPWRPGVPEDSGDPFDDLRPTPGDLYLTVDEIEGALARLVRSPWPTLDESGFLSFPYEESDDDDRLDDPSDNELVVSTEAFHTQVSEERKKRGQPAPTRPLRIGDTFWFRGGIESNDVGASRLAGEIVDVTYAARGEAKAAMAWAVSGSTKHGADLITAGAEVEEERGEESVDSVDAEPPRPTGIPGSVASPSV